MPSPLAPLVHVTLHPSAVLRAPDEARRRAELEGLVADLAVVARALASEAESRT